MEGGNFLNKRFLPVFLLLALATVHGQGTHVGYYSETCPCAESIVKSTVKSHVKSDPTFAAGLLRMHFHDCFVRGCDASVLIAGAGTERTAPPNLSLKGFEVIEDAKTKLEATCPGVVSCADILALAARDAVVLNGGRSWKVPTGRRDGRVSIASEALTFLPGPNDTVSMQKRKFDQKGLNTKDLVVLAGGHTIGTAACQSFKDRLYPNGDPSIDASFLPTLRQLCPDNTASDPKRVAMDTGSQFKFDTSYFANVRKGRGVLRSDQVLWTDASTRRIVQKYLNSGRFNHQFGKSMVKMSKIGLKTDNDGEIRKKCPAVN